MNDFDLDKRLKSVPVPERTETYWNDFPPQMTANLRRQLTKPARQNTWLPRLVWAGGFAMALALAVLCIYFHPLQATSRAVAQHERHFRLQLAKLDAGLHLLMLNPHGMGYLLTEAN